MSKNETTEKHEDNDKVEEHRKMILFSGELSDFQLKNLKTWPFIVFKNLGRVKIDYDFTGGDKSLNGGGNMIRSAGSITYNFFFDKENVYSKKDLKEKLEYLTLWTKFLFWKDTKVNFKVEGNEWKI